MQLRNVEDLKNSDGLWLRSYQVDGYQHHTRAGCIWSEMKKRTTEGSHAQKINPQYVGSLVLFEGFQYFAEWCQNQIGYTNKEIGGKFWSLDKDILIQGNKHYSPTACVFVTSAVNSLLTDSRSARGKYPIGVDFRSNINKYRARCADGNKISKYLGVYRTPEEAHRAWQVGKIETIEYVITSDDSCVLQPKVVDALERRVDMLKKDIKNNEVTIKL